MTEKTIQLRRYEVIPAMFDEFVEFMRTSIIPLRTAAGFTVEFAFANREAFEFVWAVSIEGDHERFGELAAGWAASPERAQAFEGRPTYTTNAHVDFVERIA